MLDPTRRNIKVLNQQLLQDFNQLDTLKMVTQYQMQQINTQKMTEMFKF